MSPGITAIPFLPAVYCSPSSSSPFGGGGDSSGGIGAGDDDSPTPSAPWLMQQALSVQAAVEEAVRGLDCHGSGTGGILKNSNSNRVGDNSSRAGDSVGAKKGGLCGRGNDGRESDDRGSPEIDVDKVSER